MGAAKIPEQLTERAESGRRSWHEDQVPDPLIEALKATPVQRKIVPEEENRRRPLTEGAEKGTKTIARRLAIERQLKTVQFKIALLNSRVTGHRPKGTKGAAPLIEYAQKLRMLLSNNAPLEKGKKKKPGSKRRKV